MIQNYKTIDLVGGLRADYPAHMLPICRRRKARQTVYRPRRRVIAVALLALAALIACAGIASAASTPPSKRQPCPIGHILIRKVRMWGTTPVVYEVCAHQRVSRNTK